MTPEDARFLVQAISRRSEATSKFLPATVASLDAINSLVNVKMDGDEFGAEVQLRSLVAGLRPGDRVMVMFDPPHGGYVIGRFGLSNISPGWNVLASVKNPESARIVLPVPFWAQDWEHFELRLAGQLVSGTSPGEGSQQWIRPNGQTTDIIGSMTTIRGDGTFGDSTDYTPFTTIRVAEWGTLNNNTAIIRISRRDDWCTVQSDAARISADPPFNRRFISNGRVRLTEPSLTSVVVGSVGNNTVYTSATLHGLKPESNDLAVVE